MRKYKGTPDIYDYWYDSITNITYAVVEYPEEKSKENKSNLFLIFREYNDYSKDV